MNTGDSRSGNNRASYRLNAEVNIKEAPSLMLARKVKSAVNIISALPPVKDEGNGTTLGRELQRGWGLGVGGISCCLIPKQSNPKNARHCQANVGIFTKKRVLTPWPRRPRPTPHASTWYEITDSMVQLDGGERVEGLNLRRKYSTTVPYSSHYRKKKKLWYFSID